MIFNYASRLRGRPFFGWIFACASFAAALVLRFAVDAYLPSGFPFLTFFPAVMLTAFLGGTREGIVCAVLSTLAAWYWFIPPFMSFDLGYQAIVALAFFVLVMAVDITIIHLMNEAVERAKRQEAEASMLAEERRTLFQELQHRIANNLAFVSSLLGIHKRRLSGNAEAAGALEDARLRLETLSRVHRRLYDPDTKTQKLSQSLGAICQDLIDASGRRHVTCNVVADDIVLPVERVMTLSLVLIEAVSNSLKHAFDGRESGRIDVRLVDMGGEKLALIVSDDGPGLPEGFDPATSDRLGHRIMAGFARTLRGDIAYENDSGAVMRLVFPRA